MTVTPIHKNRKPEPQPAPDVSDQDIADWLAAAKPVLTPNPPQG